MWDGWFSLHLKKDKTYQDFPQEVHSKGIGVPSLFVGSADHLEDRQMARATKQLQGKCPKAEVHNLEDTTHFHFTDLAWFMPRWLKRETKIAETWDKIESVTLDFLQSRCR